MRIARTIPCVLLAGLLVLPAADAANKSSKNSSAAFKPVKLATVPLSKIQQASRRVDQFIEAEYAKHNVKPNAPAGDAIFLRRVYLDIIGRIPTHDESASFLQSKEANKRSKLIDTLLDSEGYVSHQFNYWADLLRICSRMRYAPAQPYIDFVKDSLRANMPYDKFVTELLTAEGYTWDNGAAGYYLRDTGMPLDNMSNTAQVFLGTQLVCAQCHNHPFDSWTQKQYYQLAAFTYGIQTRDRRNSRFMEMRRMYRDEKMNREVYRAANRIMRPLAYNVNETKRRLQLPKDYQYDDAKPRQVIDPKTIFGEDVKIKPGDSPRMIYARWMTSPRNPRFATVIANRLWKRVYGRGLIEPVDDLKSGLEPSNPALMAFLVKQMVALEFDLKQYQRMLFNTKTYQRRVTAREVTADETYYFPGPLLRRLSAEQLWDSLMTMTIPHVDARKGQPAAAGRYNDGQYLVKKDMQEILELAKGEAKRRQAAMKFVQATAGMRKEMRVAQRTGDQKKVSALREKYNKIRRKIYGATGNSSRRNRPRRNRRDTDPRWRGFSRELIRAAEVQSPARPGHFLRQFGQSDRETIENANTEATVPQMLTLLNGSIHYQVMNRNSVLTKKLAAAGTPEEKLDVIFLTVLSRKPTASDQKIALPLLNQRKGYQGVSDVVWALLNTRQFMFVQ